MLSPFSGSTSHQIWKISSGVLFYVLLDHRKMEPKNMTEPLKQEGVIFLT